MNSVNSRPRQSNSRIFLALAGSVCSYGVGAALTVAVDSLCGVGGWYEARNQKGQEIKSRAGGGYLAVLALPDKVGLASAAAHLVLFLRRGAVWRRSAWRTALARGRRSSSAAPGTHESADGDGLGMGLAAGCALDLESVPKGVLLRVVGPQVGDAARARSRAAVSRLKTEEDQGRPRRRKLTLPGPPSR